MADYHTPAIATIADRHRTAITRFVLRAPTVTSFCRPLRSSLPTRAAEVATRPKAHMSTMDTVQSPPSNASPARTVTDSLRYLRPAPSLQKEF